MGFIIRGFIWDIPILIFAYVLFWGLDESSRGRLSASGFRDWALGFMVMIPEGPYTLPLWN